LCFTHRHSTSSPSPIASKPTSVNGSASSYHISSTLGKWKSGLTPFTLRFIEEVERVSGVPVTLISTRFDWRNIIDRRSW
jgi:adenylosuccinate synthase